MRRGGVINKISSVSEETLIRRILRDPNTIIEYVSRGTFGFIFKVTYRGTDPSGFEDENGNPVNVFILKVQGVDMRMKRTEDPDPDKPESEYIDERSIYPYSKQVDWDVNVVKEVLLQQQVYECSIKNGLMPPCPSILYYGTITAAELETYLSSYFVYKEYGQIPLQRDYGHFRVAIILMEYVNGESFFKLSDELFWDQGMRNKAFRSYFTALKCGVLQGDPQPQNFLVSGNNVTLIDFGSASKLTDATIAYFEPHMKAAEKGNCLPLINALKARDPENLLEDWLFRPNLNHAGIEVGTSTKLAPEILLDEDKKRSCIDGICDIKRRPLMTRGPLSRETIAENERYAAFKLRRDMELDDRKLRAEYEKYELELDNSKRKRAGGKRRSKYVGNRKRVGTRRKVQNRSF